MRGALPFGQFAFGPLVYEKAKIVRDRDCKWLALLSALVADDHSACEEICVSPPHAGDPVLRIVCATINNSEAQQEKVSCCFVFEGEVRTPK